MRVLYLCPDLTTPSGGVDQIYQHVAFLCQNGIDASVVHFTEDFRWPFSPETVPSCSLAQARLTRNDHLVLPEGWLLPDLLALPMHKHIFMQGAIGIFSANNHVDFASFSHPENILCCSELMAGMAEDFLGVKAKHVPNAIDMNLFKPSEKKKIIAYMPRKEPRLFDAVKGFFSQGSDQKYSWVPIEGMDKESVASTLSSADMFLFTGFFEGFGMPPLEAMACGAIVVGTHGYGALEYATDANGFWTDLGDIPGLVRGLQDAASMLAHDPQRTEDMKAAGMTTVKQYSFGRQREALLDYWLPRLH